MKRRYVIGLSVIVLALGAWGATRLAIRHDKLQLYDTARQRSVPVDLYVRRDKSMKAAAGLGAVAAGTAAAAATATGSGIDAEAGA